MQRPLNLNLNLCLRRHRRACRHLPDPIRGTLHPFQIGVSIRDLHGSVFGDDVGGLAAALTTYWTRPVGLICSRMRLYAVTEEFDGVQRLRPCQGWPPAWAVTPKNSTIRAVRN